jgi:hypothetical protein
VWAGIDHDNIIPLYGYCIGEEFGAYGALISPVSIRYHNLIESGLTINGFTLVVV